MKRGLTIRGPHTCLDTRSCSSQLGTAWQAGSGSRPSDAVLAGVTGGCVEGVCSSLAPGRHTGYRSGQTGGGKNGPQRAPYPEVGGGVGIITAGFLRLRANRQRPTGVAVGPGDPTLAPALIPGGPQHHCSSELPCCLAAVSAGVRVPVRVFAAVQHFLCSFATKLGSPPLCSNTWREPHSKTQKEKREL